RACRLPPVPHWQGGTGGMLRPLPGAELVVQPADGRLRVTALEAAPPDSGDPSEQLRQTRPPGELERLRQQLARMVDVPPPPARLAGGPPARVPRGPGRWARGAGWGAGGAGAAAAPTPAARWRGRAGPASRRSSPGR